MGRSIVQDWVQDLGLRHQGVLMTAIRGCDTAPKNDPSKLFVRCYRSVVLNAHCGDPARAKTFIEAVSGDELLSRFEDFRKNLDHYPHHYVMHLIHSIEIIGYKHPDWSVRAKWHAFYLILCNGLHLAMESQAELDHRLDADEETFGQRHSA